MPPLFGYEGDGKFWGEPDDLDPWKSNPYGIPVMSPEEDAAVGSFERYMRDRYGSGWSIEIDTTPRAGQRVLLTRIVGLGRITTRDMQECALEILTGIGESQIELDAGAMEQLQPVMPRPLSLPARAPERPAQRPQKAIQATEVGAVGEALLRAARENRTDGKP